MSAGAVEKAKEVLMSGYIGQGQRVEEFETALKDFFHHEFVVTTNNATSAEHLALHMLKKEVGGCDVLCTPLTCTATNWPVVLEGYNIKWVDVDPENCNMDMTDLRRKISPTTKIIYIVHWGGYPIDYRRLLEISVECKKMYGFTPIILEDCAHAMGSMWGTMHVGTVINSWATFSFQAIKHVTCVDGGALLCPDDHTYKRAKLLRWYGIDRDTNRKDFRCEDDVEEAGFKYHMNDVNAVIGHENLKTLSPYLEMNRDCALRYNNAFEPNPAIRVIPYNNKSSYWIYTMFVKRQDQFMKRMKQEGIMVSRVHERNDIHSCVKQYRSILPNLDKIIKEMICIPCGWWLSNYEIKQIIYAVNSGW